MYTMVVYLIWLILAIPALIIVVVVVGATLGAISLRRSIKAASQSRCPRCGLELGLDAILAGRERFLESIAEWRKQHPGLRARFLAEWEIRCFHCSALSYFYPESNTIKAEPLHRAAVQPRDLHAQE
jgi:hypothetical protein